MIFISVSKCHEIVFLSIKRSINFSIEYKILQPDSAITVASRPSHLL